MKLLRTTCLALFIGWLHSTILVAQTPLPSLLDDTLQLNEVVVRGYATNRRLLETPASVGLLTRRDLQQRFGIPTPIAALNTLPGVRADERSPGSYRLAIRGSAIRSPFGVRNVKAYWNELPLTDAGGNTPLNALDVRTLGRIEVIKGPSGSLYGAGTGGTLLFGGLAVPGGKTTAEVSALGGSYGLFGNGLTVQTGKANTALSLSYNYMESNGYRSHSALRRDVLNLTGSFNVSDNRTVSVLGIFSDINYQTPGGLTEAQYRADPRASRPATRTLPGSAEQQAGIRQQYGYVGISHEYRWNNRFQNTTALYGSGTNLNNPFITNYERRNEQGVGGRTVTQIRLWKGPLPTTFTLGAELLANLTVSRNYGNRRGQPDTIQTNTELTARQITAFAQAEAELPARFQFTVGLSRNDLRYGYINYPVRAVVGGLSAEPQSQLWKGVWLPRVALMRTFGANMAAFASVSTGFSPPSSQEVVPSAGGFNGELDPEYGTSYEVGLRGSALQNRLRFDVAVYDLALRETIVRRSNAAGAEFFVNAGRTSQRGLEAQLSYDVRLAAVNLLRFWSNATLTNYRFRDYQQGTVDLSNNRIPGVAPTTLIAGADLETKRGFYAHLTYQFLNPFPLNDANTATADPTRLLQATAGFRRTVGRWTVDLYASGDNLLNQTFSLGYDINALGNRFYNAAPARNFLGGVKLGVGW